MGLEWWVMALIALNGWDKYKVTRKVLGWLGTALTVLENVLVIWSGLREFDWSSVVRSGEIGDGLEWMSYDRRSHNWFDWTGS